MVVQAGAFPHSAGIGGAGWDCKRNDLIAGRYMVKEEAGRGNFARVLRCHDTERGGEVAIKMLRKEYQRDAQFEREVLEEINRKDEKFVEKVAHMTKHFQWMGHPCFRFKLYGQNLKSRKFGRHVSRHQLAALARQLGGCLHFLHFKCRMVHTDLKPENILCDDPLLSPQDGIGTSWTVCDLGSASFYRAKPDQDLISTRPYRAPEVVVSSPWSYAADMWSFGCILYEVSRGKKLFDVNADTAHLHLFQRRLGQIPPWLVRNAQQGRGRSLFDARGNLHPPPSHLQYRAGDTHAVPPLADDLRRDDDDAARSSGAGSARGGAFIDLLHECFQYDPAARLRADEVGHHDFVIHNCPSAPGETRPLETHVPPSGYTSLHIRTPGAELMAGCVPLDAAKKQQLRGMTAERPGSGARAPPAPAGEAAPAAGRLIAPPRSAPHPHPAGGGAHSDIAAELRRPPPAPPAPHAAPPARGHAPPPSLTHSASGNRDAERGWWGAARSADQMYRTSSSAYGGSAPPSVAWGQHRRTSAPARSIDGSVQSHIGSLTSTTLRRADGGHIR